MKNMPYILVTILCAVLGFAAGRCSVENTVEYSTVTLPVISDTIHVHEPIRVEIPKIADLPMIPDTVYHNDTIYITQKVDTVAIITDYQLKRFYEETLFYTDQFGKLDVKLTTQYNRLTGLSYVYTPIQQVRTIERVKVWNPFVTGSYNSFRHIGVGAGIFYHDIGLSLKYINSFGMSGWEAATYYKF